MVVHHLSIEGMIKKYDGQLNLKNYDSKRHVAMSPPPNTLSLYLLKDIYPIFLTMFQSNFGSPLSVVSLPVVFKDHLFLFLSFHVLGIDSRAFTLN